MAGEYTIVGLPAQPASFRFGRSTDKWAHGLTRAPIMPHGTDAGFAARAADGLPEGDPADVNGAGGKPFLGRSPLEKVLLQFVYQFLKFLIA